MNKNNGGHAVSSIIIKYLKALSPDKSVPAVSRPRSVATRRRDSTRRLRSRLQVCYFQVLESGASWAFWLREAGLSGYINGINLIKRVI